LQRGWRQVAVEGFERDELDVQALAGNWRLVYTTAPDVVSVLQLERTGAVQVADILQVRRAFSRKSFLVRLGQLVGTPNDCPADPHKRCCSSRERRSSRRTAA